MAAFPIRSAALFLLFTLMPQGSLTIQTTGKVYKKTTISAGALDRIQIIKTIHNVTKTYCGIICSQYEDRCNAMQLLDYKTNEGTCKLYLIAVSCIPMNSTLNVDEPIYIYIATDHSAKYRPGNQLRTSCADIRSNDPTMASGVYAIYPAGNNCTLVYCDMSTDGGGWTVIQHRQDGLVQFDRTWEEYKQGFGSAYGELWIGNTALHQLTANQSNELGVDIWDWEGEHRYAVYTTFHVANETDNFRLTVAGYSGTAGDSLKYNNNYQFSAVDQDHDTYNNYNCAAVHKSGWWYRSCSYANLNGRYYLGGVSVGVGVYWNDWKRSYYSHKVASMMTRPHQ